MNKVIMMGRLATDVTLRNTQNGNKVANYRIAVDKRYKTEGKPTADFFSCVAFGKTAEFANKYLHKGTKIAISGELQNDNFQDKEGKMVYRDTIVVQSHEFCEPRNSQSSDGRSAAPQARARQVAPTVDAEGFMNIPEGIDEELPFN